MPKEYFVLKLNKQVIDNSINGNEAKLLRFFKAFYFIKTTLKTIEF